MMPAQSRWAGEASAPGAAESAAGSTRNWGAFLTPRTNADWITMRKRTITMSESILIIDADSVAGERLQSILAAHGYNAAVANSAADALAAFDLTSWPL